MNRLSPFCLAAVCAVPLLVQASVLEPENVGELMNSASLAFDETGFAWRKVQAACPALDEAQGKGLRARDLPHHLRGQGVMVLASCRIATPPRGQSSGGSVMEGSAPVPTDRLLVVQDVSAPEVLVLVHIADDGGWRYECYAREEGDGCGMPPAFLYWGVDRVERFPE